MEEQLRKIDLKLALVLSLVRQLLHFEQKALLNAQEAANYLGIAESTLYKYTSSRLIPHYKPNGKLLGFKREDLNYWLELKRIPSDRELSD